MKRYIFVAIMGVIVALAIILSCMTIADLAQAKKPEETRVISTTYENLNIQTIEVTHETIPDVVEVTTKTEETKPLTKHYDSPLDYALQDYIRDRCEAQGVPTAIVMALIERESKGYTFAMGDDGRSFGLMQIQPKWHLQRMIQLGCTDMFNEMQNVTVGIDILAELYSQNNNTAWVLMAYNCGTGNADAFYQSGQTTEYALSVMARAAELEGGV